jgi:hypothetical protein
MHAIDRCHSLCLCLSTSPSLTHTHTHTRTHAHNSGPMTQSIFLPLLPLLLLLANYVTVDAMCKNGGTAITNGCACYTGFSGTSCEYTSCAEVNCNAGTCTSSGFDCDAMHVGVFCEVTNPCYASPCQHGSTCIPTPYSHNPLSCSCAPHTNGTLCETADICYSNTGCQNGGTCTPIDANTYMVAHVLLDGAVPSVKQPGHVPQTHVLMAARAPPEA